MKAPALFADVALSRYRLPVALAAAVAIGWLTSTLGLLIPGLLLSLVLLGFFVVLVFLRPRVGLLAYILYCFILMALGRYLPGAQLGLLIDGLLVLTWIAVICNHSEERGWSPVQNSLCVLALAWFGINLLEIGNPSGSSFLGWLYEMRSTTLYWFLTVPLCCMVFRSAQDLRLFLRLIIAMSVLGALYGIKQKVIGVADFEQRWLDGGAAATHVLWGKLRVFSFYSEAAQFGSSQAHLGVVCLILALGPFAWWKRGLLALASALTLYGMLISGTRGAMFVLVAGLFLYLLLSKQLKVLVLGCLLASGAFLILKHTSIGSSNADIARLRTSLDPQDASFQLRLSNQAKLREYLATKPFGEGVGTIGTWGHQFNPDRFTATVEPDSYYVKVWTEYGIVGFLVWFGIMLFILGKCCGIVWRTRNPQLRQKLLALTAGFGGILVSSYGNEIMNQMPSAMIIYISWVFVFLGPELDTPPTVLPADV